VTGVGLRSATDPAAGRHLAADLVVDATGRGSAAPRWLADLGFPVPEQQRLTVDVHYVSRRFRRDPTDLDGCGNVLVDVPPGARRGGVALAVEDDQWLVSLVGMVGERPPADLAGSTAYAASLWVDDLYELVVGAEPIGEASHHAFPAFIWHRYDTLPRLPERFVVSGDAVCSFDPRFGQGMTVAITEAVELGRVLDQHGLDRVGARLLAAAQPTVEDAWELATGSDLAHPDVDGPRPEAWHHTTAYLGRLLQLAHRDPEVAAAFIRVVGMIDRPEALLRPSIRGRVMAGAHEQAAAS
jgi:2-polyprenyl-6-methoxyphenol hydroxylase-like FAD-dependent oxidoreductase